MRHAFYQPVWLDHNLNIDPTSLNLCFIHYQTLNNYLQTAPNFFFKKKKTNTLENRNLITAKAHVSFSI